MATCLVCQRELVGRTWRMRLFTPLPSAVMASLDLSVPIDAPIVETCSQACLSILQHWMDLKYDLQTGRRRR